MGLFHKKTGSKLFASSFAISASETGRASKSEVDRQNEHEVTIGTVESDDDFDEPCKAVSIADVIRLIRCLPNKGTEAELFAVLKTLEIFDVDVDYLLSESARKEEVTTTRIKALNSDIKVLEDQIEQRQKEVAILEVGLNELNKVNECLILMAKLGETFDKETAGEIVEETSSSEQIASISDSDESDNITNTVEVDAADQDQTDTIGDSNANEGGNKELDAECGDSAQVIDLDSTPLDQDGNDIRKSSKIKRNKRKVDDEEVSAIA
jgi:hypothetical protein